MLLLTLHFMISNTIKLTIYARKELMRNMHIVGATDIFIKMPFIIEGILQGLMGGLVAVVAWRFEEHHSRISRSTGASRNCPFSSSRQG